MKQPISTIFKNFINDMNTLIWVIASIVFFVIAYPIGVFIYLIAGQFILSNQPNYNYYD